MRSKPLHSWKYRLRFGAAAVLMLAGSGAAQADVNAYTDDKSVDVPTGWYTYQNVTTAQIGNFLNANSARLTDIEVINPSRFNVAMVANTGVYGAGWFWYTGQTFAQVGSLLSQNNGRLIDIEPYATPDGTRFAIIMVSNTGNTARGWTWLAGATSTQVDSLVGSGQRLIQLKSYVEASRSLKVLKLISLAKHAKIAKNRFFSIRTGPQTEG